MSNRLENTPLRYYSRLSDQLGVDLWVKHDDMFAIAGGGNKARKLQHILAEGFREGYDSLVTTGSYHSNHVRAASLMAAQLGWHSRVVIHDVPREKPEGNMLLATLAGAEISYCLREEVASAMNQAMDELSRRGRKPLYIWGGGHCLEGGIAYYQAAKELSSQFNELSSSPDYIFVASGTGTTQAGLHAGSAEFLVSTKVVGISVAHSRERGMELVSNSVDELKKETKAGKSDQEICFDSEFLSGGYGKFDKELSAIIRWAAEVEGLLLDPIYTGKAFRGMCAYVRSSRVPTGSKICFWHTGGIFNLMSSSFLNCGVTACE
jgi:1-aminocyclopropane-1-carboxylate deaminase/D-cysteine desulfhydrase-like pyridoxal-dependent ACC family enzyme